MDPGLQNGLNNITGYVYSILKFLSLIGLGVAYYFVTHHGVGKAILATVAAVLLWFAPVVANIAENLGAAAAQQSTLERQPGRIAGSAIRRPGAGGARLKMALASPFGVRITDPSPVRAVA